LFLSFVDPSLVRKHLDAQAVDAAAVIGLLETRAIPAGTPVYLDDVTMLPIEPLCSWFRHLAYDDKDAKTLREYAYIMRRFIHFLHSRGRDLLDATESDLRAYRVLRMQTQDKPVSDVTWAKEAQLLNQLYRWLVDHGHLRDRPLRMGRRGRNPLTPRLRRGMDIRHMTFCPVPVLPRRRSRRAVTRLAGQQRVPRSSAAPQSSCRRPGIVHWDAPAGVVERANARTPDRSAPARRVG